LEPIANSGGTVTTGLFPTPIQVDGGYPPPPEDAGSPICSCPVQPPPPPPVCEGAGFGNAKGVCTSTADAFQQAQTDCTSQGLSLTDFQPSQGDCPAGSVQGASFECCAGSSPPAQTCETTAFANAAGFCTTDADAQKNAAAACKAQGQVLESSTGTQGSCPDGSIQSGSFTCCGSEVVGPPIEGDAGAPVPTPAPKLPVSN
jgi:hypothetical protein